MKSSKRKTLRRTARWSLLLRVHGSQWYVNHLWPEEKSNRALSCGDYTAPKNPQNLITSHSQACARNNTHTCACTHTHTRTHTNTHTHKHTHSNSYAYTHIITYTNIKAWWLHMWNESLMTSLFVCNTGKSQSKGPGLHRLSVVPNTHHGSNPFWDLLLCYKHTRTTGPHALPVLRTAQEPPEPIT